MSAAPVISTYRLQLHSGFTFADAEAQVPYLSRLGVSHLYLSPILQATPGSTHGYDVVDHDRISTQLGGPAGFRSMADAAHEQGLGVIVDVVPNHMALSAPEHLNRPLWALLRDGRDADTAHWFDIDWKAGGGRIGLPVLGTPVDQAITDGDLRRDTLDGEPVLRYFDHIWPLTLGSEDAGDIAELVQRQHYRLAWWRDKDTTLNYRRFFEVDELIAIRVELPDVFDATHRLLLDLHHEGLIDGFRIDHPDGLADPAGYLARLTEACEPDTPIWVEKILERGERLPDDWQCRGTTGYDALSALQSALVDPASTETLDRTWAACTDGETYSQMVDSAKRQVVRSSLTPEVDRLTRRAREALPELDPDRLREAVVEVLVAGAVYRAYIQPDQRIGAAAGERLRAAFTEAAQGRPDLIPEIDGLIPLALIVGDDDIATDFGVRLQQTWGPVMAKGIEDTTFYRWHRLIALNEVGSDPSAPDPEADSLHRWCAWTQQHWPESMTTLSTHDTKRSEDVRARLIAVAGDPDRWQNLADVAQAEARRAHVDAPTAHFVWQTLLGVEPIDDERLTDYLRKSLREAKIHTSWTSSDQTYEQRVIDFALRSRAAGPLHDAIEEALLLGAEPIRATTLSAKLLQLTMAGVPDVYQGCEVVRRALVDPDNRRPVDFDANAALLTTAQHRAVGLTAEKILVTHMALSTRRRLPGVFDRTSSYEPLRADSDHAIGFVRAADSRRLSKLFDRTEAATVAVIATRAPARLAATGGWTDQRVELAAGSWHDLLTGRQHESDGRVRCRDLLSRMPVALLERTP